MTIRLKLLSAVLALCLLLPLLSLSAFAGSTLRLSNESDIKTLLCNPGNWGAGTTFLLTRDIAIPDAAYEEGGVFEGGFVPVGTSGQPFCATLIGNDYTISNLRIVQSEPLPAEAVYAGLFGCMKDATVRNLVLRASFDYACTFTVCELAVGGLAGFCEGSVIQNCDVSLTLTGSLTGTAAGTFSQIFAGAFFGRASGINAFRCTAELRFTGMSVFSGTVTANIGAFAGSLSDSDLSDCVTGGFVCPADSAAYLFETSAPLTVNAGGLAGTFEGTTLTSCKSGCELRIPALADASFTGTLCVNAGGLAGQIYSGYIDKCAVSGDIDVSGHLRQNGARALCAGGLAGRLLLSDNESLCLASCDYTGALAVSGLSPEGAPPSGATYTAAGGIAGTAGGTGTITITDCCFFGTADTFEQTPLTSLQTVYSGGIVGRAMTENAPLEITGCLSNGTQTVNNGGYVYAGGLLGSAAGNNLTLDTCLYSGKLTVEGAGSYFYAAGAVACTAAGTSNPAGSVIRGTLSAGSVSVAAESAAVFKASFACMLRRTSVVSSCAADSSLKSVISPSPVVSGYTYTAGITAVIAADAGTEASYDALTAAGGWSWSALFMRPVFTKAASGYAGALWAEPGTAGNPIKFNQPDEFYDKGAVVGCDAYTDIPSPYPLSRLVSYVSSSAAVAAVNGDTVSAVGGGKAAVTAYYSQYDASGSAAAFSDVFYIYVRPDTRPVLVAADTARYLTLFCANNDLYAAADAIENAFGTAPALYVGGVLADGGSMKTSLVQTGLVTAVFPEAAGLGTDPVYLVMAGDCFGDGAVDGLDAARALGAAVHAYSFDGTDAGTAQKYAADVNADGVIDALDAMCIELCASGHTTLPD